MIGEQRAEEGQLDFWDRELVENGSYLMRQRQIMVAEVNDLAQPIHHEISSGESLKITYLPSVTGDFPESLKDARKKETVQGMSLVGPHRDDLAFLVNDVDMNIYGSRGQQRTVALSLKLAEASFMRSKIADHPVLLLDDVLSELDVTRRHHLLEAIASYQQVVITTTDLDRFDPGFLSEAALFRVSAGRVTALSPESCSG